MSRFLAAALVAALPGLAFAQPGGVQIVDAKVASGRLEWVETVAVPVQKTVQYEEVQDGKKVVKTKAVTVMELVQKTALAELKNVKATDAAGKAIAAEKLAELLKDGKSIVIGSVTEKQRALFKDTTVFVEVQVVPGAVLPPIAVPLPVNPAPKAVPLPAPIPGKKNAPNLIGD